jgi:hypothetical protein
MRRESQKRPANTKFQRRYRLPVVHSKLTPGIDNISQSDSFARMRSHMEGITTRVPKADKAFPSYSRREDITQPTMAAT